ncbi:unnamed protein product [Caenorhabditis brenneri]
MILPFQKLPFLVMQIVLQTIGFIDFEEIHFCSEEKDIGNVFYVNIGTVNKVPSSYTEEELDTFTLSTYWSLPKIGFNAVNDAVSEVFGAKVNEVIMNENKIPVVKYQNEIDWIENQFPALQTFGTIKLCSFQDYVWLMKNVRAKK